MAIMSGKAGHVFLIDTQRSFVDHASGDAADALAVAICHSHHRATSRSWAAGVEDPLRAAGAGRE